MLADELYAFSPLGRESYQAYLQETGQKVVLKKKEAFVDKKLVDYLSRIQMKGLPHVMGHVNWKNQEWLVLTFIEGESIKNKSLAVEDLINIAEDFMTFLEKLKNLTGYNWYFLDLKSSHIVLDADNKISLIDFEHTILAKETRIFWKDIEKLGLSSAYASPQVKEEFFDKNHHEYALALILLETISGEPALELNQRKRKKLIKSFPEVWQKKLIRALDGKGFKEITDKTFQITTSDLPQIFENYGPELEQAKESRPISNELQTNLNEPFLFQHKIHIGDGKILNLKITFSIE